MPGNQIKNWPQYEKLKAKGYSKRKAAKITNSSWAKGHKKSGLRRPVAKVRRK